MKEVTRDGDKNIVPKSGRRSPSYGEKKRRTRKKQKKKTE